MRRRPQQTTVRLMGPVIWMESHQLERVSEVSEGHVKWIKEVDAASRMAGQTKGTYMKRPHLTHCTIFTTTWHLRPTSGTVALLEEKFLQILGAALFPHSQNNSGMRLHQMEKRGNGLIRRARKMCREIFRDHYVILLLRLVLLCRV